MKQRMCHIPGCPLIATNTVRIVLPAKPGWFRRDSFVLNVCSIDADRMVEGPLKAEKTRAIV